MGLIKKASSLESELEREGIFVSQTIDIFWALIKYKGLIAAGLLTVALIFGTRGRLSVAAAREVVVEFQRVHFSEGESYERWCFHNPRIDTSFMEAMKKKAPRVGGERRSYASSPIVSGISEYPVSPSS